MKKIETGKRTYYCAVVEFYDYGAVKTAIITRERKTKPKNQIGKPYGMTSYWDWFESHEAAEAFLTERTLKARAA